jgi:hypothetical protein
MVSVDAHGAAKASVFSLALRPDSQSVVKRLQKHVEKLSRGIATLFLELIFFMQQAAASGVA